MNTVTRFCNVLYMSVIFFNVLSVQGMESTFVNLCAEASADRSTFVKTTQPSHKAMAGRLADKSVVFKFKNSDLWKLIERDYQSYRLKDALTYDDATVLDPYGFCLLHGLVLQNCYGEIYSIDGFLKKGELLVHAIPDKINALNRRETPVDVAYFGWKTSQVMMRGTPCAFTKLSYLYKSHGGKTVQELVKDSMPLLLHNDSCVGDLAILPHDVRKYIVEYMMLYFKKQVTEEMPDERYECSICRTEQAKNKS